MAKRKRRQPAALRRYWANKRKGHKKHATPRRRRRARKNWANSGAMVPVPNPRRRRRGYRMNKRRRHHRRHHYRRNPAFLGMTLPGLPEVGYGVLGFVAPPLVSGFLTTLAPSIMQTTTNAGLIGKYAMKAGTILLTSWGVRKFAGPSAGNAVMIGGGINIGMSLLYDFAPGMLPANPLSAYVPVRPGLHAYLPTRPELRAVVPMRAPARQPAAVGSGQPRIMPPGTAVNVGANEMWGPASRYQRY